MSGACFQHAGRTKSRHRSRSPRLTSGTTVAGIIWRRNGGNRASNALDVEPIEPGDWKPDRGSGNAKASTSMTTERGPDPNLVDIPPSLPEGVPRSILEWNPEGALSTCNGTYLVDYRSFSRWLRGWQVCVDTGMVGCSRHEKADCLHPHVGGRGARSANFRLACARRYSLYRRDGGMRRRHQRHRDKRGGPIRFSNGRYGCRCRLQVSRTSVRTAARTLVPISWKLEKRKNRVVPVWREEAGQAGSFRCWPRTRSPPDD